jgi:CubicO group peptidase (beta-lactamase class C family)
MPTRRHFLQTSALAAAATVVARSAWPQANQDFRAAFDRLERFIPAHLNAINAPGLTLSVVSRDGLSRIGTYGLAEVDTRTPVRPEHLFEIGSITKSFTAIALLQLVDEGRLDLQKPLQSYLPWLDLKNSYRAVTTHDLLSHSSGMPGDAPLFPRAPYGRLWIGAEPGKHFHYSNTGYTILGLLLEALDDRPLAEIFRRRILGPVGMRDTAPIITFGVRERMATGYQPYYGDRPHPLAGRLAEAPYIELEEGSGSIASTPADMGRYMQMLLAGGRAPGARVLSEAAYKLLIKPVIPAPQFGEHTSYAYGLAITEDEGRTIARHTGGMVAFSSAMQLDLTNGFGAFASVNANLQGYRPNVVARYALDLLAAAAKGASLPDPPPLAPQLEPKQAAEYAGTYTSPDGAKLTVAGEGDRLLLDFGGQRAKLSGLAGDSFVPEHPELGLHALQFNRDKEKKIEDVLFGNGWFMHPRYSGPKTFEYPKEWGAFPGQYRNESPWWGDARVFLRKGKLWLFNDELEPLNNGLFRVGGEFSPELVQFDRIVSGRALRMNLSGVDLYRTVR